MISDAMIKDYSLPKILKRLHLSKSSYYYSKQALKTPDKYKELKKDITDIFNSNYQCYGYRRVKVELKFGGTVVSEKVVRRLMKEQRLCVKAVHKRHYSSYKGEISPEVPNLLKRNFHTAQPSKK